MPHITLVSGSWQELEGPVTALRTAVFLEEQGVPEEEVFDGGEGGDLHGVLLEEDMLDPSTWDILYKDCGGGSQVGEWNRYTNYNEFGTGVNMAFIHDDQLQSLYETAASIDGHNKVNMSAFHAYVLEQGYYYAAVSPQINAVYAPAFATLAYAEGEFFIPGACEYYLD